MPKVSFVCSVYNAKKYIIPFLNSIREQDYKDYEAIFVDAASTDGSREILADYAQKDPRINLFKEAHISIAAAVNIGLKKAQGEYIARIDADNLLFPSFLSDQVDYLEKHPETDFVIADQLKINANNEILGMIPFLISDYAMKKHLLFKTALGGAPMVGRRTAFFEVGLYEETTIITEDRIFALKAMQNKKFASLNKINYAYRIHEDAITRRYTKTKEHHDQVKIYEQKYIKLQDYYNDLTRYQDVLNMDLAYKDLIRKKIANTILYCGLHLADLGKIEDSIKELDKAAVIYPKNRLFYNILLWQIKEKKKNIEEFSKK
ncbi:MAG: glycosyltransferase family 2 protein, partial [Candidatus Margulisbacteria bacterium]|nr:glycosyltransferase family 2 protein [Candidatus Margulisiibacteriota bacterium]